MKKLLRSVLFLAIGLFVGWLFFSRNSGEKVPVQEPTPTAQKTTQIWTCAMHPQIREDHPGKCPICGMELIPVNEGNSDIKEAQAISLSPGEEKLAEVQITRVTSGKPERELHLPGKVAPDERLISNITAHYPGRIEKLYVSFTGEDVQVGEKIASIYSPQLISAQKELLEAAQMQKTNPGLLNAAKNKLKLWNISDQQINGILQHGSPVNYFDVLATQSGTVLKKNVNVGDYVNDGTPLFDIANLNHVWVMFDAYETDLPWIHKGDKISFSVTSNPGEELTGKVIFIDPVINGATRAASVRVEVDNNKGLLKPGMLASGVIHAVLPQWNNALIIPKSAVLWTGKRSIVYVADSTKPGTFHLREVTLGPQAGENYIITDGLKAGELVASQGVFKIDASAQLQGKPSMMSMTSDTLYPTSPQ